MSKTIVWLRRHSLSPILMDARGVPEPLPSTRAIPDAAVRSRGLPLLGVVAAILFLLGSMLLSLLHGPMPIGVGSIVDSALAHLSFVHVRSPLNEQESGIVWYVRAPRMVLGALVGGMLAAAGASYQGVFHNPLCDPYLLGVAGGAGLGATFAIVDGSAATAGNWLIPLAAFAGALGAVTVTYALGRSAGVGRTTGALVLAGVTMATFTAAVQTFVQQQHTQQLQNIYSWLLGGFSTSTWMDVAICAPYIVASSLLLVLHRRVLDVLSLGDDEAASLGINVGRTRLMIVAAATLGTAAAVSVSGLIAFVGIIVPHTIRLLVSTSYRAVVPLSLIVGAGFLVLTDFAARTILSPAELPIGVVTAFLGAPFFAIVLRTSRSVSM
jgi:iron complex transport system permease protein